MSTPRERLERLTREIGEKRDELRRLIDEVEPLLESTNEAVELLEQAADKLSEYA